MGNNSCRKCGLRMEVHQNCSICKNAIEFICHKCNRNTNKEIHSMCLVKNMLLTT